MRTIGLFICAVIFLGCALIRGNTDVTNPKTGPGTDYPCGVDGTVCKDTNPYTCCAAHGECAKDSDGPYCNFVVPNDPADPTTFGVKPIRTSRWQIK